MPEGRDGNRNIRAATINFFYGSWKEMKFHIIGIISGLVITAIIIGLSHNSVQDKVQPKATPAIPHGEYKIRTEWIIKQEPQGDLTIKSFELDNGVVCYVYSNTITNSTGLDCGK